MATSEEKMKPNEIHMENLEWLVENALHGEVNGDVPEDLDRIVKARVELTAIKEHLHWTEGARKLADRFHRAHTAKMLESNRLCNEGPNDERGPEN